VKGVLLALLLAYVPSPTSILKEAAQRARLLGRTREVTMTGTLTVLGGAPKAGTLTLHLPSSCKLEAEGGTSFSVKGLGTTAAPEPAAALLKLACPLLTTRGLPMGEAVGALRAAAEGAGVDLTSGAGLARLGDRVVYVLGANSRDQAKPQLWVYKDSHAPARLIAQGGGDLRLLQYGNPAAADWFPRVFELWERGQLSARFEVLETRGVRVAGEEDEDDSRE
jgi:hypothetical protein